MTARHDPEADFQCADCGREAARLHTVAGRLVCEPACVPTGPCIFTGCVATWRHWHGGFPGGYDNPAEPEGPPIPFTGDNPDPSAVRDYNGAALPATDRRRAVVGASQLPASTPTGISAAGPGAGAGSRPIA